MFVGFGTLVFIIRCDIVFFYAMTVPVVLLVLAFPFRLYICTLLIPIGSYVAIYVRGGLVRLSFDLLTSV